VTLHQNEARGVGQRKALVVIPLDDLLGSFDVVRRDPEDGRCTGPKLVQEVEGMVATKATEKERVAFSNYLVGGIGIPLLTADQFGSRGGLGVVSVLRVHQRQIP
jgi:hypothetical protein